MRLAVGVLFCLNVGALSLALADPAATPSAEVTAAPAAAPAPAAAAANAAAATPATAPAKPAIDPDEKRFISQGYRLEMHNGEKVFCRREPVTGTRLGEAKHCSTLGQLKLLEQESKDVTEKIQRTQKNPQGS